VSEIRRELGHKSHELARLLKTVRAAELAVPADHAVATAFATLDSLAASIEVDHLTRFSWTCSDARLVRSANW
jgi:hypothetical protein